MKTHSKDDRTNWALIPLALEYCRRAGIETAEEQLIEVGLAEASTRENKRAPGNKALDIKLRQNLWVMYLHPILRVEQVATSNIDIFTQGEVTYLNAGDVVASDLLEKQVGGESNRATYVWKPPL